MIRRCGPEDAARMFTIINQAAVAYDGAIPADCYHRPYMPATELAGEMERVDFYGYEDGGELVGVMGIEPVGDVTLIRHAYVLPENQGRGIGKAMLDYLKELNRTERLLVGTWAAADWAVRFYENNGFTLQPEKDALLTEYWDIPTRQIETSVVLGMENGRGEEKDHE